MEEVSRNLERVKYKQSRGSECLEGWKILIVSGKSCWLTHHLTSKRQYFEIKENFRPVIFP